jgi:rubrerythrin
VSRLPRALEHLKTAFNAEAEKAALYRAFAARADRDGLPNLAAHWRQLAEARDARAIAQVEAAGRVHGAAIDLAAAISGESYQKDLLYPKMMSQVDADTAAVFETTIAALAEDLQRLEELRNEYNASQGDVSAP